VGAWNPGLGPSGLTLRDWSPYKNHGTLTNMPASDAWKISDGQHVMDFDGSDDFVTNPSQVAWDWGSFPGYSISLWVFLRSYKQTTFNKPIQIGKQDALTGVQFWGFGTDHEGRNTFYYFSGDARYFYGNISSLNTWHHLVFVKRGTSLEIWANGRLDAATSLLGTPGTNATTPLLIGRHNNQAHDGQLSDISIHTRAFQPSEIRLLASRRGIAYEMAPRNWSAQQIAAYRARYYSQVVGGGVI
jgi:hypothetical protein